MLSKNCAYHIYESLVLLLSLVSIDHSRQEPKLGGSIIVNGSSKRKRIQKTSRDISPPDIFDPCISVLLDVSACDSLKYVNFVSSFSSLVPLHENLTAFDDLTLESLRNVLKVIYAPYKSRKMENLLLQHLKKIKSRNFAPIWSIREGIQDIEGHRKFDSEFFFFNS